MVDVQQKQMYCTSKQQHALPFLQRLGQKRIKLNVIHSAHEASTFHPSPSNA
jgi:hypothetical protein